ncbi:predicted protein [Botrytis cinerea T4]|uniref:Uncharacterized protein n=1 Tax=Botryotinia fuckeliana (strain T4) TaxID=999810 RepID=G2XV50_BOTF4|nr:predicted protein [Botrytis cinerea T4]
MIREGCPVKGVIKTKTMFQQQTLAWVGSHELCDTIDTGWHRTIVHSPQEYCFMIQSTARA